MSATARHLQSLNNEQRMAASHGTGRTGGGVEAGPLLVIAGAGTGKTSTLAHRVAHLVVHGVDPARILLLTFSRRAAQEMRRRALAILRDSQPPLPGQKGNSRAEALAQRLTWSGTFHSMANRLLRHYAPQLALDPCFNVVDRGDSADLLDQLRTELGMAAKEQRFPRKDSCLAIYSHRVNSGLPLAETLLRQFPWCAQWEAELTRLFRAYVQRKQQYSLLDYDDLLLYWHILVEDPQLARHVGAQFDHILVDEYQDTNALQGRILDAIRPDGAGLTVVGDDAQSIYSFRAAEVENILGFAQRYDPPATVVPLVTNYRSTQPVLDAANELMVEAPRQYPRRLQAARGAGALPRYVSVEDLSSQAEYVALQVLERREAGVPLRRQAVLFRTGSHSDLLEIELTRRGIPFMKYGGLKFLEAAHVKDVLAVLRWAENPRNQLAALRTLQLLPGMGPVHARAVLDSYAAAGSLPGQLRDVPVPARCQEAFAPLVELIEALGGPERPWPGQMRLAVDWYAPHLARIHEHHEVRRGDLEQLEQLSAQFPSRERFLTELTLDPPQASSDLAGDAHRDEDYLVLSTVHSAKGMEWDTVFVLNVVDGSFPSEFATSKPQALAEERRLLYVAMTRARDELQLLQPLKFPLTQQAPRGDAHVYGGRSRFMTARLMARFEHSAYGAARPQEPSPAPGPAAGIDAGSRIRDMW